MGATPPDTLNPRPQTHGILSFRSEISLQVFHSQPNGRSEPWGRGAVVRLLENLFPFVSPNGLHVRQQGATQFPEHVAGRK